jgi:hypothetical protein
MASNHPKSAWRILYGLLAFLSAMIVCLGVYSQVISDQTSNRVFSETGPFEQASPILWLALGALVVALAQRLDAITLSTLVVCAACAAREWDLHKAFTGYSVVNPGFYITSEFPIHHQLIGGALVALLAASSGVLLWYAWRVWPRGRQPVAPWIWALGIAGVMLVGTKLFDRAPAILAEDFEIVLSPAMSRLFTAWEEGLEATLPVAFAAMVLAYRFRRNPQPRTEDEPA